VCIRCRRFLTSGGPLAPQELLVWPKIDSYSSYICLCECVCKREYAIAAEDGDCALAFPDESNLYLLRSFAGSNEIIGGGEVNPTAGLFLYNTPLLGCFFSVWSKSLKKMEKERVKMYSERKKETCRM